jgi:hypothetical protein
MVAYFRLFTDPPPRQQQRRGSCPDGLPQQLTLSARQHRRDRRFRAAVFMVGSFIGRQRERRGRRGEE